MTQFSYKKVLFISQEILTKKNVGSFAFNFMDFESLPIQAVAKTFQLHFFNYLDIWFIDFIDVKFWIKKSAFSNNIFSSAFEWSRKTKDSGFRSKLEKTKIIFRGGHFLRIFSVLKKSIAIYLATFDINMILLYFCLKFKCTYVLLILLIWKLL